MDLPALARRLLLAAAVVAGGYYLLTPGPDPLEDLGRAPALAGDDASGRPLSLGGFSGQVVLVDFWATWCPGCREELGGLSALHEDLRGRGFTVLGVSVDANTAAVAPFARDARLPFPILLKPGPPAPEGWSVPGLPIAYLVGRDGRVLRRYDGMKDMKAVKADVKAALAL
ncbi:MAG: TlpA family protein disulfide reductase [Elusimicrobia bacterium]|nr:TlpA family protein disulfide reductase [Elusimicrobiota bacterium]